MTRISSIIPALAALGAGLVHLAIAAGAPLALALPFALFGVAELLWSVLALARDRLPVPRLALPAAFTPVAVWMAVLVTAPALASAELPVLPLLVATLFDVVVAGFLAAALRRGRSATPSAQAVPPAPARVGARVFALIGSALVVGGLTTPALALTEPGEHARPHGSHGVTLEIPGGGGHH